MAQLRRFTATGSWMLAFGLSLDGISRVAEESGALAGIGILQIALLLIAVTAIAAASSWGFSRIGSRRFKGEKGNEEEGLFAQPHIT